MKIGIFDPYLDDLGGGERYMMTIASCLSKKHSVDVFWDNKKDLDDIAKRFSLDLVKINLKENIFNKKSSYLSKMTISRKYDAIIMLSDGSIPLLLSKKIYLHMQQPISHKLSVKEKLKLRKVDKIFCNSEFTKNFIEENYDVSSEVIYPPVSIYGNKTNKENIILHVGRFRVLNVNSQDYKKQQIMIDTFKKMVDEGLNDWKFLLAISLRDKFDKSFTKMNKSANGYPIEFLINSSNEKLWKEGAKAKIYWHATGFGEDLAKSPHLAEHFGISTVEAMGVGAVPIVFSAGGQKEIVTDGKDGFLWENTKDLIDKTNKLINDKVFINKMSNEAYKRSKFFSDENFCKKIYQLLNV